MHLALLGVSKLVLGLWMSKSRALHTNLHAIENRMRQIQVPTEISREPRGLSELKHWKGTVAYVTQ